MSLPVILRPEAEDGTLRPGYWATFGELQDTRSEPEG